MLCFNDTLSDIDIIAFKKALEYILNKESNKRVATNFYSKRPINIRYLGKNKMTETLFIYKFEDLSTGEIFYMHTSNCGTMSL